MSGGAAPEHPALGRVGRRLIPYLFLLYVVCFLDRINVSFAALQMNQDLGLSATQYGLGAGSFFIGYVLFQVPANLILARVGARRWIAAIMIIWGLVSGAMALIHSAGQFYALRVLLGFAEAGFFPGVILYLTEWFPSVARARAVAAFMTAIPIAGILGSPLSGALLEMHGIGGLAGWRWLFLLEALPAVVFGIVTPFYLTDTPREAGWLEAGERDWLVAELAAERQRLAPAAAASVAEAFASGAVWLLGALWWLLVVALYGLQLWLPQILRSMGVASDFRVGLLAAIPTIISAVAMVVVGRRSDRTGERYFHVAGPALLGAVGLALAALLHSVPAVLAAFSVAFCLQGTYGPFWTLPGRLLGGGNASAAGIALINSIGNTAGFAGPYLLGWVRDQTQGFTGGLLVLAACPVVAVGLVLLLRARHLRVGEITVRETAASQTPQRLRSD